MQQFETAQKFGKDNMDAALKSFDALSKGVQSLAVETADYAKRSFEQGNSAIQNLTGARTFDRALEIQNEFVRTSYESMVAQATRVGELVTTTAKGVFAPVEGLVAKTAQA